MNNQSILNPQPQNLNDYLKNQKNIIDNLGINNFPNTPLGTVGRGAFTGNSINDVDTVKLIMIQNQLSRMEKKLEELEENNKLLCNLLKEMLIRFE